MLQLSDLSLRFGEELARITLGIDKLFRDEINGVESMDGLVVINMGHTVPRVFESYAAARDALRELMPSAMLLPEEDRRLYYTQACISLDSFCAYRMGLLPDLTSQIGMFLHVNCAAPSAAELDAYCREADQLLTSAGYTGSLKEKAAKWQEKNLCPADEVQGTMDSLIKVARERTANILELPTEEYHCVTERGGAFSARSDFDHLRVIVNIDPVYTMQAMKHLVCHEVYPGHYMQFTLRKVYYERGYAAADGLLSVVNHSSSSTFEGIADTSMQFIDWGDTEDDRIFKALSTIKGCMGPLSSYMYHVEKRSKEQVAEALRKYTFIGGEGAIASRLRYIDDQSRAALIWSYWRGDQGVEGVWNRVQPEDRAAFYEYIYGRLHTVQSMELFKK